MVFQTAGTTRSCMHASPALSTVQAFRDDAVTRFGNQLLSSVTSTGLRERLGNACPGGPEDAQEKPIALARGRRNDRPHFLGRESFWGLPVLDAGSNRTRGALRIGQYACAAHRQRLGWHGGVRARHARRSYTRRFVSDSLSALVRLVGGCSRSIRWAAKPVPESELCLFVCSPTPSESASTVFVAFAERAEHEQSSPLERLVWDRPTEEHDNIRAVVHWCGHTRGCVEVTMPWNAAPYLGDLCKLAVRGRAPA